MHLVFEMLYVAIQSVPHAIIKLWIWPIIDASRFRLVIHWLLESLMLSVLLHFLFLQHSFHPLAQATLKYKFNQLFFHELKMC